MSNKIVIGSRESKLAVLQSQMVQDFIVQNHPDMEVDILTMKTTGDKILDRTLDKIGGKGLFVKELDRALLEGRSQLSVHSLKDMPMEESEELPILAFSKIFLFLSVKKEEHHRVPFLFRSHQFTFCLIRLCILAAADQKSHAQQDKQQNPASFSHRNLHFPINLFRRCLLYPHYAPNGFFYAKH